MWWVEKHRWQRVPQHSLQKVSLVLHFTDTCVPSQVPHCLCLVPISALLTGPSGKAEVSVSLDNRQYRKWSELYVFLSIRCAKLCSGTAENFMSHTNEHRPPDCKSDGCQDQQVAFKEVPEHMPGQYNCHITKIASLSFLIFLKALIFLLFILNIHCIVQLHAYLYRWLYIAFLVTWHGYGLFHSV